MLPFSRSRACYLGSFCSFLRVSSSRLIFLARNSFLTSLSFIRVPKVARPNCLKLSRLASLLFLVFKVRGESWKVSLAAIKLLEVLGDFLLRIKILSK